MSSYTVLPNQSLFDIAVQVYGDVNAVVWLLQDNPTLLGVTDRLEVNQVLQVRDAPMNTRNRDYLAEFGPIQTTEDEDKPVGIGYWRLRDYQIP